MDQSCKEQASPNGPCFLRFAEYTDAALVYGAELFGGLVWPRTQTRRGRWIIVPPLPAEEEVAVQEEAEEGKSAVY